MNDDTIDQLLDIAEQIVQGGIPEYQDNETFISGAFDLLLIKKRGAEAFDLLHQVCQRYQELKALGHSLEGYFYLVSELARQTETTEMPGGMAVLIRENPDLADGLKEWYRVPGYRDRRKPHSSPLPHHAAYGSVLRDSADQAESDPGERKSK